MTILSPAIRLSDHSQSETRAEEFFRQSHGNWRSQRRYYTLKNDTVQEVVSSITVEFLPFGDERLIHLSQVHGLGDGTSLKFGALTTWESDYVGPSPRQVNGSTVFGVLGSSLYRDRGFNTSSPIIAHYTMGDNHTMTLHTEYDGNVFEEELKLVGSHYRVRQTIISRAQEQLMIGQYLENRI